MALTNKELRWVFMIGYASIIYMSIKIIHELHSSNVSQETEFSLTFDPTNPNDDSNASCPMNLTLLEDTIIPQNKTSGIPRQIHVVVRDRCVSHDVKDSLYKWKLHGYSLLFHDDKAADTLLTIHRPTFPQLSASTKCLTTSTLKTELVKLLFLWDEGGIIVDGNKIPGDELLRGDIIEEKDEGLFFMSGDETKLYSTDYMAAIPNHPIVYTLIQKTFADFFLQVTSESFLPHTNAERKNGYFEFIMKYIFSNVTNVQSRRSTNEGMAHRVTLVNTTNAEDTYFMNATLPQQIDELSASSMDSCVNWDVTHKDLISLQELVVSTEPKCPNGQYVIQDTIHPRSIDGKRKIPKIVHVTSKTRCAPKEIVDNVNTWRFEDYSFFLHDDVAVARLLARDWPEFPLLHEAINCITSGAGFADLWRYLVLWEYGGIYTDLDNAPGPWFKNATIIKDDMDSFLEVEAAKFPSQYFITASPHHPAMYMAVQNTIQRLFTEQNIVQQYVPFVTGPGALKWAVVSIYLLHLVFTCP